MNLVQFSNGTLVSAADVSIQVNTPHAEYRPNPADLVNPFADAAAAQPVAVDTSSSQDDNAQQATAEPAQTASDAPADPASDAPDADAAATAAKAMEPVSVTTGAKPKSGKN